MKPEDRMYKIEYAAKELAYSKRNGFARMSEVTVVAMDVRAALEKLCCDTSDIVHVESVSPITHPPRVIL